jgi:hypothetical protein
VVSADRAVTAGVGADDRYQTRQEKESEHLLSGTVQQVFVLMHS